MTVQAQAAPLSAGLPAISLTDRPILGILAVMLGAFISSLNTKLTTFGLADIRGGLSLGFDEGSWVGTAFGAAQMVVTPAAAWMSTVLSTRRVLLWTGAIFTDHLAAAAAHPRHRRACRRAIHPRAGGRRLHPRGAGLCAAQPGAAMVDVGHRRLCVPLRLLAEHRRRGGGLVLGKRKLAMDLLAKHSADLGDARPRRDRDAAPAHRPHAASPNRLDSNCLRGDRLRADLCRARPGQPARLVQFGPGLRPVARRFGVGRRVLYP